MMGTLRHRHAGYVPTLSQRSDGVLPPHASLADDGTIPCRSAKCGGEFTKHYRLTARKAFTCERCGTHVYPMAGTIFENSTTPLKSWFYAMYLIRSTRAGISATVRARERSASERCRR